MSAPNSYRALLRKASHQLRNHHLGADLADEIDAALSGSDGPGMRWIPLTESQPAGSGWVLCSHPVLGIEGVVIRDAEAVRAWANDPQDRSMMDACWMPLPSSHATGTLQEKINGL